MKKQSFTVYYNGKNVAVNVVDDHIFLAQISYKPLYLKLSADSHGGRTWCDSEMNLETPLSKEIGGLIESHPSFSDAVPEPVNEETY